MDKVKHTEYDDEGKPLKGKKVILPPPSEIHEYRTVAMPGLRPMHEVLREENDALQARLTRVEAAVQPFMPGSDWGKWKAWLVHGPTTVEEGIKAARSITAFQVNLEQALAEPQGGGEG